MPRLFVAIDFPETVKDRLIRLCSGLAGVRWVKRDQMHLTLRFIGETDTTQFEALQTALAALQAAPFDMRLEGVGQFPPKGKPRVLWAGVKAPPALIDLQRRIETAVNALGFEPEDRPFSPHITLARLKFPPPPESIRQFMAIHADFRTETFLVTAFALYSSVLSPQGAAYRHEAVYRLDGA